MRGNNAHTIHKNKDITEKKDAPCLNITYKKIKDIHNTSFFSKKEVLLS